FPGAVWPKKADKFAFLDLKTHRVGRARLVVTTPHQPFDRPAQSTLLAIGAIDLGQVASFNGTHCHLSAFLSHVQGVRAINLRPDGKLLHAIGISWCLAPKARYSFSLGQRSRNLWSPDLGGILECGGKRSATPLCFAHIRGNYESLDALCVRGSYRYEKSAVAASLCRRSPKW